MKLHRDISLEDLPATDKGLFFREPANLVRLFKISGFAEGRAVLVENECMPPAPACVILEDDAIGVTATTVRVPVFYSHSESVNVETREPVSAPEVIALLQEALNLKR